nr:hypothetical protein [Mesorhizobium loti]
MTKLFRQGFATTLLAGTLATSLGVALAAPACRGVDTKLTAQRKADYAKLVARSLNQKVKPSKVTIQGFMQSGTWTVVYADVPVADPGYFFFDSSSGDPVFKEVWGGMADAGEGPQIAKWARKLGANKAIASCFAHAVTD